jgi:hypothetical protein
MQGTNDVANGLNIVITPGDGDILCQMGPVWTPNDPPVILGIGHCLYSPSRAFRLNMQQGDGNLVLQYVQASNLPQNWPNRPLNPEDVTWITYWATYTQDKSANYLAMQYDGNLVVYHEDNTRLGSFSGGGVPGGDNTGTYGNISAFLRLQDDGNMFITDHRPGH